MEKRILSLSRIFTHYDPIKTVGGVAIPRGMIIKHSYFFWGYQGLLSPELNKEDYDEYALMDAVCQTSMRGYKIKENFEINHVYIHDDDIINVHGTADTMNFMTNFNILQLNSLEF